MSLYLVSQAQKEAPKTLSAEYTAKVERVRLVVQKANRSELARETGLTRPYVSQILSGKSIPSLTTAARLARLLRVSIDAFYAYWRYHSDELN